MNTGYKCMSFIKLKRYVKVINSNVSLNLVWTLRLSYGEGPMGVSGLNVNNQIQQCTDPLGRMHERRLSLNPSLVPDLVLNTIIFRMHEGRLSLIRDLVPVLNQQKLILLGGRFKGGLNSD